MALEKAWLGRVRIAQAHVRGADVDEDRDNVEAIVARNALGQHFEGLVGAPGCWECFRATYQWAVDLGLMVPRGNFSR